MLSEVCDFGSALQRLSVGYLPFPATRAKQFSNAKCCCEHFSTKKIGITCILNLLAGGYEIKRLNISVQCIFLDYCAYKKHSDKNGAATTLNIEQLVCRVR